MKRDREMPRNRSDYLEKVQTPKEIRGRERTLLGTQRLFPLEKTSQLVWTKDRNGRTLCAGWQQRRIDMGNDTTLGDDDGAEELGVGMRMSGRKN